MALEDRTLGSLLSDPRIAAVAKDAIRHRDLSKEKTWDMTLETLKGELFFNGEIGEGIERLYQAADTGAWYYPLYTEEETAAVHKYMIETALAHGVRPRVEIFGEPEDALPYIEMGVRDFCFGDQIGTMRKFLNGPSVKMRGLMP